MSVRFDRRRRRLHIGFRAEDWSDVWMVLIDPPHEDPDADAGNPDGEYEFEFYPNSTGDQGRREPMPGEIIWHSHFDPQHCISRYPSEKKKLHHRFMSDAHLYLSLNDPAQIRKWEEKLNRPRFARWQSWFDIAKKYQRSRHPELRQGEDNNDDDDDDSAYDSDEERRDGHAGPMGPPTRPVGSRKRKAPGSGRKTPGSKRSKFGVNGSQTRLNDSYFQMSGGRGPLSIQSGSVPRSISADHDNESDIFDPSAPEGLIDTNNNIINGHEPDEIQSPVGSRRRGNSREESITPFNDWAQNKEPRDSAQDEQDEDRRRVEAFNGNVDFDTAERLARDQSEHPAPSINGDLDDEAAYQAAMEASMSSSSS